MTAPDHLYLDSTHCKYDVTSYDQYGNVTFAATDVSAGVHRSLIDLFNVDSVSSPGWGNSNRWGKTWRLPINSYAKDIVLTQDPGFQTFSQTERPAGSGPSWRTEYAFRANAKMLGVDVQRVNWPGTEADDPYQQVVAKLIDKIKRDDSDLGVAAAEIGRTASMVAQSAIKLVRALRALKSCRFGEFLSVLGVTASRRKVDRYYTGVRKHFGRAGVGFRYDRRFKMSRQQQEAQFMDFTARTWLEYTYGWKPLLQDVYDVAKTASELCAESAYLWRTVRARAHNERVANGQNIQGQIAVGHASNSRISREIVIEYSVPQTGLYSTAAAFGLTNPWSVAWEVVPFSFVADWFIPIGKMLESISAYDGLVFKRGASMLRHVYSNTVHITPGPPYTTGGHTYTCTASDVRATTLEIGIRRELMSSFPDVQYPKVKDPRSISHGLSAIALLQQAFLSRRS